MPNYTVQDSATGKKITFEWTGIEPPSENDMIEIFAEARKSESRSELELESPEEKKGLMETQTTGALETAKNIGLVYPVAETAANLATSTYGVPISGLAGLFALPFGKGAETVEAVQKALVYQPQTEGGKQLTQAATYPVEKLEQGAEIAAKPIEKAGYPDIAAAVHTGIVAAPVIAGAKAALKPSAIQIEKKINKAIDTGINKAIRPSVVKKETRSQMVQYRNKARTAIKEIVVNKNNLNIIDKLGGKVEGLPKTLDQFSQAIDQVKKSIFEEYDTLAKQSGKIGVKINLPDIAKQLDSVVKSKVLKDISPETIKYAKNRIAVLKKRGFYTTVETQEAIQMLNQTLENFYRNPSPEMKGKAMVDSLIVNNLRKSLDVAINNTTGKNYQLLKHKYGSLRMLETDVTKRTIVDARKNNKGLLDFSDIYTGYHVVKGLLSKDPATTAAGLGAKIIAGYYKMRNDPNRIVRSMFEDVEKLQLRMK